MTLVNLNSVPVPEREKKKIPSGWKQNGGIASTEMPPLEKAKSV